MLWGAFLTGLATGILWGYNRFIIQPNRDSEAALQQNEERARTQAIGALASHMDTVLAIQGAQISQVKIANAATLEILAGGGVYTKPEINRIIDRTNSRIEAIETDINIIKSRMVRARIK